MMSTMGMLSFDAERVEAWGAFSGDRNPIHFSREAARRLGAEDIVVHGMLPLMYVQARCAAVGARYLGRGGWKTWSARLKRPLLQGHEARLDLEGARGGLSFALTDRGGTVSYLRGRFEDATRRTKAPLPAPRAVGSVQLQPVRLDGELLVARERAMLERFPEPASIPWIRLSAIAFAAFLSSSGELLYRAAVERLHGDGGVSGDVLQEAVTVVQTVQTVTFDVDHLDAADGAGVEGCECTFAPAHIFVVGKCCSGSVDFRVVLGGRCVMEMSVGLMLRAPGAR